LKPMLIPTKKLHPEAILPRRMTEYAAAYDFFSTEEGHIPMAGSKVLGTGIAMAIPEDYVLLIFSRSGHGFKFDTTLANSVGVIDSDYRGEIKIKLSRSSHVFSEPLHIAKGDRIAQGLLIKREDMVFKEVQELPETARGEGGFGHTDNLENK
jgi:dUTP pyrophosphatase